MDSTAERLPAISAIETAALVVSLAVAALCIGAAYTHPSGSGRPDDFAYLWVGLAVLVAAPSWVFLRRQLPPAADVGLVTAAGAVSYLPKLLLSWSEPAYFDELLHLGQSHQLAAHGALLGHNPMDPTVGHFPLFQLGVVGVRDLSSMSLWHASLLVAGVSHTVMILSVYLLVAEALGRRQVAGLAAIVYLAGPAVIFWLSQASYETLALPLAVLTLWAAMRWARQRSRAWLAAAVAGTLLATVAQPVSALFLSVMLILLAIVAGYRTRGGTDHHAAYAYLVLGQASVICNLVWIGVNGWSSIWSYLLPSGDAAVHALRAILSLGRHRSFFTHSDLPSYERYAGFLSVPLTAAFVAAGLWTRIVRRKRYRSAVALDAFLVLGVAYLLIYPFNLSHYTEVWVDRSWELLWIGLSAVVALVLTQWTRPDRVSSLLAALCRPAVALVSVVALLVGNTAITTPIGYIFAVPYYFESGVGLATSSQLAAASWLRTHTPGARIASDLDTDDVQWVFGHAHPLTGFPTWMITFPHRRLPVSTAGEAQADHLQYLVVDRLMYREASFIGYVYSAWEPDGYHAHPLPAASYDNLFATPWLEPVYQNRQITIFRVLPDPVAIAKAAGAPR